MTARPVESQTWHRPTRFWANPIARAGRSTGDHERFILPIDSAWSLQKRPFGIHHCGNDPDRFAASYAKIPHLDFLDVGWGGDVKVIREHLPNTFLNIRLDPVFETVEELRERGSPRGRGGASLTA